VQLSLANPGFETFTKEFVNGRIRLESFASIMKCNLLGSLSVGKMTMLSNSLVGRYFNIGSFSFISRASVGNYSSVGSRVSIGPLNHPYDRPVNNEISYTDFTDFFGETFTDQQRSDYSDKYADKRAEIGSDVWIGDNSVILSSVTVGHGCVIGAGSVVTKSTEPYGVYVGNPARLLKKRFIDSDIEKLLESNWWNLQITEFPPCKLFDSVECFLDAITTTRKLET